MSGLILLAAAASLVAALLPGSAAAAPAAAEEYVLELPGVAGTEPEDGSEDEARAAPAPPGGVVGERAGRSTLAAAGEALAGPAGVALGAAALLAIALAVDRRQPR